MMNHTEKLKKLISGKKGFIETSDFTEYKKYVKSEYKNIPKLMRYAELFKIATIVRGYIEVLL